MELQFAGQATGTVEVADDIFSCAFNEPLIHQVVTAYLAGGRAGTAAQKNRAAVSGGGIKPWRQMGTGRARDGTILSPLWRTGGVTFAAQPRSYQQKVNRKMYRGALRSILSELIRAERLYIVDSFSLDTPKTKDFIAKISPFNLGARVLIVTEMLEENLYLATRNLSFVDARDVSAIDPVALVNNDSILITVGALKQIEELLQ